MKKTSDPWWFER